MTLQEVEERLNVIVKLLPANRSNRPGGSFEKTSVTIHNTDNASEGADALAHAAYMDSADARRRRVSWHYSVDDARAVKHLPMKERSWHTGNRTANGRSISIEICMNRGINQSAANERAALLAALLIVTNEMEGETTQLLKKHEDWTGKHCPSLLRSASKWNAFVNQVDDFRAQINI